jgi:hypothetical protein
LSHRGLIACVAAPWVLTDTNLDYDAALSPAMPMEECEGKKQ